VSNPAKRKGDHAEREVAAMFNDELGLDARRALGAGRADDVGDIHGVPNAVISVANYASLDRAVREKLPDVELQRLNARVEYGAMFCRRRGGSYVVVMTPEQFATLWREAA
jgi:Holliday junction resolvase